MIITGTIQKRRDTSANWAAINPLLLEGEEGYETDTGKTKMGDGITHWNGLTYNGTAQAQTGLVSGGAITTGVFGGNNVRVAAAVWYIATQGSFSTATNTDFNVSLSSLGTFRYIGFFGDNSNTITKVEGGEGTAASYPATPVGSCPIGYILVTDGSIASTPDLSGYLLKADKANQYSNKTGTDDETYVTPFANFIKRDKAVVEEITGNYTLVNTDTDTFFWGTALSSWTFTIPINLASPFRIGDSFTIYNHHNSTNTIVLTPFNVSVEIEGGRLPIYPGETARIVRRGTNTWTKEDTLTLHSPTITGIPITTTPDGTQPKQITTVDYVAAAQAAAQSYADGLVIGLWDDRGNYNASGNTFPASGGSGTAGAILKGDIWTVSVGGTLGGVVVAAGDTVRALVNSPGQTGSNWALGENNFGYAPENSANKNASSGYPGLSTYDLQLKNAAGSVTSLLKSLSTSARNWTFPDKDLTVAGTADLPYDISSLRFSGKRYTSRYGAETSINANGLTGSAIFIPYCTGEPHSINELFINVNSSPTANYTVRLAFYSATSAGYPDVPLVESGSIPLSSSGIISYSFSSLALTNKMYFMAYQVAGSGGTVPVIQGTVSPMQLLYFDTNAGGTGMCTVFKSTQAYGAFPNPLAAGADTRLGANGWNILMGVKIA